MTKNRSDLSKRKYHHHCGTVVQHGRTLDWSSRCDEFKSHPSHSWCKRSVGSKAALQAVWSKFDSCSCNHNIMTKRGLMVRPRTVDAVDGSSNLPAWKAFPETPPLKTNWRWCEISNAPGRPGGNQSNWLKSHEKSKPKEVMRDLNV